MKNKTFVIKNLSPRAIKRKAQFKVTYANTCLAVVCLTFLLMCLIVPPIYRYFCPQIIKPFGYPIRIDNIKVNAVEAMPIQDESYYKAEPLRYLRYRGQQLGIDEHTITKIITMLKTCENKNLDPEAININTDKYRSLDVGIFQINMYWHRFDVTLIDMLDPVKNIDYGYKLFLDQGFEPWSCAHKLGYVK